MKDDEEMYDVNSRCLHEAVKAIVFFDLFDRPLKEAELRKYMRATGCGDFKISTLEKQTEGLKFESGYCFLRGRNSIVSSSEERKSRSDEYMEKSKRYLSYLKYVPFVNAVAVCNNVAFGSADDESDIDVFIITRKGRIFLARVVSTILLQIAGLRRHGSKIKGRFCLSFYVAGADFSLEDIAIDNDYYLYFWGKYLVPVWGHDEFREFFKINERFLKGENISDLVCKEGGAGLTRVAGERLLNGRMGQFLENRLERWHLRRFESKENSLGTEHGVVVGKNMLKFHNTDRRKYYRDEFEKRMATISVCGG